MKLNTQKSNSRLRGLARWLGVVLGTLVVSQAGAVSTTPFYEPFPVAANPYNGVGYGTSENLGAAGSSATIWTFGNSASSTSGRIVTAAALSYPGLTNIDAGGVSSGVATRQNNTSTKDRGVSLAFPNSPGAVYASCLINIQVQTNAATYAFFGLTTNTGGTSINHNGAVVYFDTTGHLLVAKNSATPATNTTYALAPATTHLVVVRYKYNPGAPDQVDLWLDPASLGDDTKVPAPNITTTNNANVGTNYFSAVAYFCSALPTAFYFDEVRAATNWAAVTPATPAPGSAYLVSGGGSGCAGDSFLINLSGSDLNVNYELYTNGVDAGVSVAGTGSPVNFGPQSATATYSVLASNTVTAAAGWMSGKTSVTVLSPPGIATQPTPVVVATNGLCAFNVSATGSGLNYQWYRNGTALVDGGHVSGSQSTNLVVSSASVADVATVLNGYYVVITNQCGARAVSVTNSLALDQAASLVWSGDGVSNLWDVATSANWNTQSAVFNYGDNVTFDDTSANTSVNLTGGILSPGSITINGTQSFTFNGNSTLAGLGSLLMNSSGTLTLNRPNSTSGGLIIASGVVSFLNANQLGTGLITLAGGTLAAGNLSTVTINNPILVTNDSTIQINNTTGSALTINNTLSGTGGTLTFYNNKSSAGPVIQLTAPGLVFNQPIVLNTGAGTGLILAGNNSSGTQTFNGIISGGGSIQRNNAGGTTLLTETNLYTGATILFAGSLGVGADTISSSPPTLDAGPLGVGTLRINTSVGNTTLYASGGAHTIGNPVLFDNPTNQVSTFTIGGSYDLALSGTIDLNGTNRLLQVTNTGATVLSGAITDDGLVFGINKSGSGALYLDGVNNYTGSTTNTAGLLAGLGTIAGPVVIQSGATIGAGDPAALGTLTISSDFTLAGNAFFRVDKSLSPAQSNDVISVSGVLANLGSGTLTVSNAGPALVVGDQFFLFSQPLPNGNALTVTGGGANWQNNLAADGSITVTSIVTSQPPTINSVTTSGASLIFSGSNGSAGSGYYVLSSTNLLTPRASWKREATNTFGAGGAFSVTNAIGTGSKFFLLQLQ